MQTCIKQPCTWPNKCLASPFEDSSPEKAPENSFARGTGLGRTTGTASTSHSKIAQCTPQERQRISPSHCMTL